MWLIDVFLVNLEIINGILWILLFVFAFYEEFYWILKRINKNYFYFVEKRSQEIDLIKKKYENEYNNEKFYIFFWFKKKKNIYWYKYIFFVDNLFI
jgi:hypothetical protein